MKLRWLWDLKYNTDLRPLLKILENILKWYDDLRAERLCRTDPYPSKARKGLGRHIQKGSAEGRFCRGRKVRKRGYRKNPRQISTVFGLLKLPVRIVEFLKCGAYYSPLLRALDNGYTAIEDPTPHTRHNQSTQRGKQSA